MRNYSPRRASKRWLNGAPDYILDCFDDKTCADRYTIFFGKQFAFHCDKRGGAINPGCGEYGNTYLTGLGTSENGGVSGSLEMSAHDVAAYRYRVKHRRIAWLDLPESTRAFVMSYAESE